MLSGCEATCGLFSLIIKFVNSLCSSHFMSTACAAFMFLSSFSIHLLVFFIINAIL